MLEFLNEANWWCLLLLTTIPSIFVRMVIIQMGTKK